MKRILQILPLLAAALFLGACNAPKQTVTTDTKNSPKYFGPAITNKVTVNPVYPGETVKKAIPVAQPSAATRVGNNAEVRPTPKYYGWGVIDPQIWHVHMNDQGHFTSKPIKHGKKTYLCRVGQYGTVSWGRKGLFGLYWAVNEMDYVKVDQAVIDDANRQIAAANKVRPFVPAGPLPDSERVGFVTVNWGSMKTVMAEQSAILQKNTMTASDVRTANGG